MHKTRTKKLNTGTHKQYSQRHKKNTSGERPKANVQLLTIIRTTAIMKINYFLEGSTRNESSGGHQRTDRFKTDPANNNMNRNKDEDELWWQMICTKILKRNNKKIKVIARSLISTLCSFLICRAPNTRRSLFPVAPPNVWAAIRVGLCRWSVAAQQQMMWWPVEACHSVRNHWFAWTVID